MATDNPRILVEACVDSIASALAAEAAGANRLELCGSGNGGTTPSFGMMSRCRALVQVPVHVMIRAREGDFEYSEDDFAVMMKDVSAARSAGADGVVFGVLMRDNTLDAIRMSQLIAAARPLRVACHRAFDATPDANTALDALIELGIDIVLTSGHQPTALAGVQQLASHVRRAEGKIAVMAGGRIRAENVLEVAEAAGVPAVHVRATDPVVFAALMQRLGRQAMQARF